MRTAFVPVGTTLEKLTVNPPVKLSDVQPEVLLDIFPVAGLDTLCQVPPLGSPLTGAYNKSCVIVKTG
jgi:hypothetical protein